MVRFIGHTQTYKGAYILFSIERLGKAVPVREEARVGEIGGSRGSASWTPAGLVGSRTVKGCRTPSSGSTRSRRRAAMQQFDQPLPSPPRFFFGSFRLLSDEQTWLPCEAAVVRNVELFGLGSFPWRKSGRSGCIARQRIGRPPNGCLGYLDSHDGRVDPTRSPPPALPPPSLPPHGRPPHSGLHATQQPTRPHRLLPQPSA